jgi:transposase-like protein
MSSPAEPTTATSTANAADGNRNASEGRRRSPLRKLGDEQELELTRLYAESDMPVPEIARRFGVGESSVYRISQRHGASLRGSSGSSSAGRAKAAPKVQAAPRTRAASRTKTAAASTGRRAQATRGAQSRARSQGTTTTRRQRTTAASAARASGTRATRTRAAGTRAASSRAASTRGARRFRVVFTADTVIEAATMQAAVARAEAIGATDITSVSRVD